jgi:hypothetical protein
MTETKYLTDGDGDYLSVCCGAKLTLYVQLGTTLVGGCAECGKATDAAKCEHCHGTGVYENDDESEQVCVCRAISPDEQLERGGEEAKAAREVAAAARGMGFTS